jgi:hypothetical protein
MVQHVPQTEIAVKANGPGSLLQPALTNPQIRRRAPGEIHLCPKSPAFKPHNRPLLWGSFTARSHIPGGITSSTFPAAFSLARLMRLFSLTQKCKLNPSRFQ